MEEMDTKDRILKGAEELFVRYGIRSVSMDDIAHQLGISKKTLYQHFADKDDIVTSAMDVHIRKKFAAMESAKARNAIEELVQMSERLKESIKNANPSLLFDIQKYHHKAWTAWKDYRNKYVRESLVQNLKEGIEQGYYRTELNPEVVATLRLELIQLGFDEQFFPNDKFATAEVQTQLLDHFTEGILTAKGKKLYRKYKTNTSFSLRSWLKGKDCAVG